LRILFFTAAVVLFTSAAVLQEVFGIWSCTTVVGVVSMASAICDPTEAVLFCFFRIDKLRRFVFVWLERAVYVCCVLS
jgi:hypothetical protein